MYHPCNLEYIMPKIITEKSIFKSKLFNIKQAKIKFDNQILDYEIISGTGSGAVLIVPILDDEIIFNSGLRLMNENVYIENSYKLKFQSYIHTSYSKRLIDKERGYWEILNEW